MDIMLDDQLTPYLIEVNTSPSMSSSSPIDKHIKTSLLHGAFNVIGFTPVDRKAVKREKERKEKQVSRKALSFCCVSTRIVSKTMPFLAVCLSLQGLLAPQSNGATQSLAKQMAVKGMLGE
eukprot:SAG22_NODE_1500_length_4283_cov_5.412285_2_plen_121_part_00